MFGVQLDDNRFQKALRPRRPRRHLRPDSLEHNPLVGRVLIDEIHAVGPLRRHVGALDLPEDPKRRQGLPGRQRSRARASRQSGRLPRPPMRHRLHSRWGEGFDGPEGGAPRPGCGEGLRDTGVCDLRHRRVGRQRVPDRLL